MKKYAISAFVALTITALANAGGPNDYVGSIWLTAAQYCPEGTMEANGQVLAVYENPQLYALYGFAYGGDGRMTFAVPDMRGRMPIGIGVLSDKNVLLGDKIGRENASFNLPSHTHVASFSPSNSTPILIDILASSNIGGNTNQPSVSNSYIAASSDGNMGADMWSNVLGKPYINLDGVSSSGGVLDGIVVVSNAGASIPAPIPTIPPQLGLRFCITTSGNWPQQP